MASEDGPSEPAPGVLYDAEQRIELAIRALEDEAGGEGVLITGWVVVAEWVDGDGSPTLSAYAREGMPYWRINSLVDCAPLEMIYDDEYDDDL